MRKKDNVFQIFFLESEHFQTFLVVWFFHTILDGQLLDEASFKDHMPQ